MAQEFSFDVVSKFDHQELANAVDQTRREIGTRFDFKGVTAEVTLAERELTLLSESEFKLDAIFEMLQGRAIKRGLSPKVFDRGKVEQAARGNVRQVIKLREGIDDDLSRDLAKRIKGVSPKVQARIQGDTLRVSSRDKDTLQTVQRQLRELDIPTPLQFTNYR
jgi:uncharacterized protein YajQ (UPF0234 family)